MGMIINPYISGPPSWGTAVADPGLNADDNSRANIGIRNIFEPQIFQKIGDSVRVTFYASSTASLTIDGAFIGNRSGAGVDFDGNQVRLTFSGGNSTTISAGSSVTSDSVSFPMRFENDIIVSIGVANDASNDGSRYQSSGFSAGNDTAAKVGGNGEEGDTTVTGYSSPSSGTEIVGLIEAYS